MSLHAADATLDRLLRHMAWANTHVIARLQEQTDAAVIAVAPGSTWTVGETIDHLVMAAEGYARRLDGMPGVPDFPIPSTVAELDHLAVLSPGFDARLRAAAGDSASDVTYTRPNGEQVTMPRSTILAQAIHHATEHRAQIAGALAANGIDAIDLDAIDLWAFGEAESS
jgi:uncharacterized damage-inducible protein DinB